MLLPRSRHSIPASELRNGAPSWLLLPRSRHSIPASELRNGAPSWLLLPRSRHSSPASELRNGAPSQNGDGSGRNRPHELRVPKITKIGKNSLK
ncbi:MAG: hypothetical protein IJI41_03765 [Anaerolineaceae bacterium]|nr:hypothetical protein [Anaerolineaceae bacterium]